MADRKKREGGREAETATDSNRNKHKAGERREEEEGVCLANGTHGKWRLDCR